MHSTHNPWVIILAGGSGARLSSLTTNADGVVVPKQYCSLRGGRSLLLDTIGRALQLAPRSRIVVVVLAEHEIWWRQQLTGSSTENILVQPQNRGTAAGLLLALASIRARDLHARVVMMPSDHCIDQPAVMTATLQRALQQVQLDPSRVVLLGITPDNPDTGYGWIVPGTPRGQAHLVDSFVEKPPLKQAEALLAQGALWHSFLCAADATMLWNLCHARQPLLTTTLLDAFELPEPRRRAELERAYALLPSVDFARDILPGAEDRLLLLPVPPCGWTDLGTPQRLAECLRRIEHRAVGKPPRTPWFAGVDLATAMQAQSEQAV